MFNLKASTWKVLCDSCGMRYEQSDLVKPRECGACGSLDILIGKVQETQEKELELNERAFKALMDPNVDDMLDIMRDESEEE